MAPDRSNRALPCWEVAKTGRTYVSDSQDLAPGSKGLLRLSTLEWLCNSFQMMFDKGMADDFARFGLALAGSGPGRRSGCRRAALDEVLWSVGGVGSQETATYFAACC